MGWERKRGKLEELNRLPARRDRHELRGCRSATSRSCRRSATCSRSTATRACRATPRARSIGILAHPLNRPRFDPAPRARRRRATASCSRASASRTRAPPARCFARVYAGHTGVDPYTTAVSDTYQDLFGEGIFTGKGLYDVDAFTAALAGRVPENALLSHDLFEGLHARTALVTDVEVVDDYPANVLAHARRQHRWVRGDWQILALAPARRPDARGPRAQPPAAHQRSGRSSTTSGAASSRRRSSRSSSRAWTVLPGSARLDARRARGRSALPLVSARSTRCSAVPRPQQPSARLRARIVEDARDGARAGARRARVPPVPRLGDGRTRSSLTLVRLVITGRRLLEWETAAGAAARAPGSSSRRTRASFFVEMAASPLAAVLTTLLVAAARPRGASARAAVALLWALAPVRRVRGSAAPRRPSARDALATRIASCFRRIARARGATSRRSPATRTTACRPTTSRRRRSARRRAPHLADEHRPGAPRDARRPRPRLHRRSRARRPRSRRRSGRIEGLERYEGHLLNWYDTRTLRRSQPRYVSTVDSGNLAGRSGRLAEALAELASRVPRRSTPRLADARAPRASRSPTGWTSRFLYDARAPALRDRLPPARSRRAGPARRLVLRPPRVRGAPRELLRDREGRRARRATGSASGGLVVERATACRRSLSWSATMFEYLMPLLLMRTYPGTLLDAACRMAVRRQTRLRARARRAVGHLGVGVPRRRPRRELPVPAFGVPGLGFKRGLARRARGRAVRDRARGAARPRATAARNLRRLDARGRARRARLLRRDRLHAARPPSRTTPVTDTARAASIVHAYFAHHQGMSLVALANVSSTTRMVERFHADPRVQATELLLQERVPREAPVIEPRPRRGDAHGAAAARRARRAASARRTRRSRTRTSSRTAPTSRSSQRRRRRRALWTDRAVTRWRERRDARSGRTVRLPARRPHGRRLVRDAISRRRASRRTTSSTFLAGEGRLPAPRRRDRDAPRGRRLARGRRRGPPPVAHEPRRAAARDRDHELRRARRSAARARTSRIPRSASSSSRPSTLPEHAALLCAAAAARRGGAGADRVPRPGVDGRPQAPVEWETDRARFLGRGREPDDPQALDGRALSGTTAPCSIPILSLRTRVRLAPGGFARLSSRPASRPTRERGARASRRSTTTRASRPRDVRARLHARADLAPPPRASRRTRRSSSSGSRRASSASTPRCARPRGRPRRNTLGPVGPLAARHLGRPADRARARRRGRTTCRSCGRCLQAQEYWRLKGLATTS